MRRYEFIDEHAEIHRVRHRRHADSAAVSQRTFKCIEICYDRELGHQAVGYLGLAEFESRHEESIAA